MRTTKEKTYIATSDVDGVGMFVNEEVKKGEDIYMCLGLIIPRMASANNILESYVLPWDDFNDVLALGKCSFLNNGKSNARIEFEDFSETHVIVRCVATEDLKTGEEVFIDYEEVFGEGER